MEIAAHPVPVAPRRFTMDATPEALATLMTLHGERFAILNAEGGEVFEMAAGRYSDKPNIGVYLAGHSGEPLRTDRVNRKEEIADEPILTVCIAVQPCVIESLAHTPEFRGRGFLARIWYSTPADLMGTRFQNGTPPEIEAHVTEEWDRNVQRLLDTPDLLGENGRPVARTLTLSDEARALLFGFRAREEPRLLEGGDLRAVADWVSKRTGTVARIAGLLHVASVQEEPSRVPISAATMVAALALGSYFTEHSLAAFQLMKADPITRTALRMVRWLERRGQSIFSPREAYKDLALSAEEMREPLGLLEDLHYIRRTESLGPGPRKAGRPKGTRYEVNPTLLMGATADE